MGNIAEDNEHNEQFKFADLTMVMFVSFLNCACRSNLVYSAILPAFQKYVVQLRTQKKVNKDRSAYVGTDKSTYLMSPETRETLDILQTKFTCVNAWNLYQFDRVWRKVPRSYPMSPKIGQLK